MTSDAEARRYIEWAEADVPKDRTFENWHDKGTVFLRDTLARLSHDRGADAEKRLATALYAAFDDGDFMAAHLNARSLTDAVIDIIADSAAFSLPAPTLPARGAESAIRRIFEAFDRSNNVPMYLAAVIRDEREALDAV